MPVSVFREAVLRALYDAHAERDIELAVSGLTEDVEWPDVAGGRVLHGHDEVREYWTAQFAAIDPSVTPVAFDLTDEGEVEVRVHQVVRDLAGTVLRDDEVTHTYAFAADGRIRRMVVR